MERVFVRNSSASDCVIVLNDSSPRTRAEAYTDSDRPYVRDLCFDLNNSEMSMGEATQFLERNGYAHSMNLEG